MMLQGSSGLMLGALTVRFPERRGNRTDKSPSAIRTYAAAHTTSGLKIPPTSQPLRPLRFPNQPFSALSSANPRWHFDTFRRTESVAAFWKWKAGYFG